jgi:hypothetical protein
MPSKRNGKNVTAAETHDNAVGAGRMTEYERGYEDGVKAEKKRMLDAVDRMRLGRAKEKVIDAILE